MTYLFPVPLSNTPSQPVARTITAGTAYQATIPTKPAAVTITVTSAATLTLGGGTTLACDIVTGTVATIATTGGNIVGKYKNSLTGAVIVGVNMGNDQTCSYLLDLCPGDYFAVRNVTGAPTIVSCMDQSIG